MCGWRGEAIVPFLTLIHETDTDDILTSSFLVFPLNDQLRFTQHCGSDQMTHETQSELSWEELRSSETHKPTHVGVHVVYIKAETRGAHVQSLQEVARSAETLSRKKTKKLQCNLKLEWFPSFPWKSVIRFYLVPSDKTATTRCLSHLLSSSACRVFAIIALQPERKKQEVCDQRN